MPLDRRNFIEVVECPRSGETGLMLKGLKRHEDIFADTGSGLSIAHDLVEHVNGLKAIGSVGDELEAFGAIWFVRGQFAAFDNHRYSPEEVMGMEYASLSRYYETVPLRVSVEREARNRPDLDEVWAVIEPHMRESSDHEDFDMSGIDDYIRDARVLFKRGYMKAERRYPDAAFAYNQFSAICRAVTRLGSFYEDDLGRTFELRWGGMYASIRECDSGMDRYY